MDKEQINELKPGDEVLIRGRFEKIKENGDFSVSYLLTTVSGKLYWYKAAVHPSAVIIKSPPKYDPTRLFKKGDKVRVKNVNGRHYNLWSEKVENQIFVVAEDERARANVHLDVGENRSYGIDPAYLELVLPVEELELYDVECDDDDKEYSVTCRDKFVCTFPYDSDSFYTKEQAKAAAEAERDRLNAEYRKEQNDA